MSAGANETGLGLPLLLKRAQPDTATLGSCLSRLAELAATRASIAAEEAESLAELARIVDVDLAGWADQSVTSHVTLEAEIAARATEERELMSQGDLADLLGAHPRTIRRMELAGEIPASISVGRLKRWRRSEVQEWLDNGRPRRRARRR